MKVYEYDNLPGDQRLPHDSNVPVATSSLDSLGVLSRQYGNLDQVNALAKERGYRNRDQIIVSPTSLGDAYESKVKMFFEEHLHEDEEIRYILDGVGYFDVRDDTPEGNGRWIRIRVEKGDLIVLPAGIYHRFTTDESNYTQALRLFKDEPKWESHGRSPVADVNIHRKQYLDQILPNGDQ